MEPVTIALTLAKFAPELVRWVTGNEKAAEAIVDVAKKVSGKEDGESAIAAIEADPNLALEFRKAVMANALEFDRIYLSDIQDARKMQVAALGQDDVFSKRFAYYFAAGWSLFSMIYFVLVTFVGVAEGSQNNANLILGFLLGTSLAGIFGWLYGTTVRSSKKDETIRMLSSR